MSRLSLRVAARHQRAYEFNTDKAREDYLKEHPNADPKNHSVKKDEGGHGKPGEHGAKKPKASWKDFAKSLSAKAKSFVESAPAAIKSFVHDDKFRSTCLQKAHESIKAAPKKFVLRVIEETKEEAHEIGEAGEGLIAALRGQKLTDNQKDSLKRIATHVLIATVATALTGGIGVGAAALAKGTAGAFTSSLAKKIALKAITPKLASLPTLEELGHGAHGAAHQVQHLFEHFTTHLASEEKLNPRDVFAEFVAAVAAEAIKDLDADTLKEALDDASQESAG